MIDILHDIVAQKKTDLVWQKKQVSLAQLQELVGEDRAGLKRRQDRARNFLTGLADRSQAHIIAEIKRHSPSKGPLRPDLNPLDLADEYVANGAYAISVLTEKNFFRGSGEDLRQIRSRQTLSLLRKDFILEAYQIYESALLGADIILLIAAILSTEEIVRFQQLAESLNLICLIEVHDCAEVEKVLPAGPQLVGVNNRNLVDFRVSLGVSYRLIEKYRSQIPFWISESGIDRPEDIVKLREVGFQGFLIGESLLKSTSPGAKLRELIEKSMKTKEQYFAEFQKMSESHPVLLYAKGTKEMPRCGFSAQTVEILKSYGVDFEVVDVLSDMQRKEYLKEYSNWPTIPQLYIQGELVGGADITLELHKSGQLKDLIVAKRG